MISGWFENTTKILSFHWPETIKAVAKLGKHQGRPGGYLGKTY